MPVPAAVYVAATAFQIGSQLLSGFLGNRAAAQRQRAADRMAKDAIDRGEEEVTIYRQRLAGMLGRQRAVMGASGVALNTGSAAQVTADTRRIGELDMATIRKNAQREAFGIKKGGQVAARSDRNMAFRDAMDGVGTLIGKGVNAWERYSDRRDSTRAISAPFDSRWNTTDWGG